MKRGFLPFLTALALCLGLALPAGAQVSQAADSGNETVSHTIGEEQPAEKLWKITMGGRIMTNRGNRIWVLLNQPQNMQIDNKGKAMDYIILPIGEATAFTDEAGEPLSSAKFLANQEVRVTFRYHWRSDNPNNSAQVVDCLQLALSGEAQRVRSYASVDDFGEEVLVGTVVSNKGGKLEVFVEHGRVTYSKGSDYATEYSTSGWYTIDTKDLPVFGTDSKRFEPRLLERGVRVALYPEEAVWQETGPPSYHAESFKKVRALGKGEEMFTPEELRSTERLTCTVKTVEKLANGDDFPIYQLILVPAAGSRLLKRQAEYPLGVLDDPIMEIVYGTDGKLTTLDALRPGMQLDVWYEGINTGTSPRSLSHCHRIDILPE